MKEQDVTRSKYFAKSFPWLHKEKDMGRRNWLMRVFMKHKNEMEKLIQYGYVLPSLNLLTMFKTIATNGDYLAEYYLPTW